MEFTYTAEQEELIRVLRGFVRRELVPHSRAWDRSGEFPWDAWRLMGELGLLGLRSIADGAGGPSANGGYPKLSAEYIIKTNPDYIFLADAKCCKQSAATVAARPGWSGIEAVTARRVVPLDDDIASRWGPRIVDLVRVIAAALNR